MNWFKKTPKLPIIVVASRNPKAFESFNPSEANVFEAVTTRGLIRALESSPALMVVDIEDVVATSDVTIEALQFALNTALRNGVPILNSTNLGETGFDAATLSQARTNSGVRFVLPKVVVVTNYAGGIGKTTLSLAMARSFCRVTGLGAAVIEAGVGASSLGPKLSLTTNSLYEIATQKEKPKSWEGADLYPLSMREAQVLAGDTRLNETFKNIVQSHTLTIIDASPLSPLWSQALQLADEILVIATPRGDTIAQADATYRELSELMAAKNSKKKPVLVMNMVRSISERISLGSDLGAWVPLNEHAAKNFGDELGVPVLNMLYSGFDRLAGQSKAEKKAFGKPAHSEAASA
jgi:hypothetical protein